MNQQAAVDKTLKFQIRSVDAFLDRDGSPLAVPRLHPELAEEIWKQALRQRPVCGFRLEFITPAGDADRVGEVREAIKYHFANREEDFQEELDSIFREGWRSLGIGLLLVALFLTIAEAILHIGEGRLINALAESLVIVAWVALWHPGDLLFYAHFPVRGHRRLARALSEAEVVVKA